MSSERMPQPEDIAKNQQPVTNSAFDDKNKKEINLNANETNQAKESSLEDGEDNDKVEDEGKKDTNQFEKEAAASLGLHRVTEKMLSTIKASRDIERNQRNVISKLALKSNGEEEEEEEEGDDYDEDEGDDEENEGSEGNADERTPNNNIEATKKRAIELKASQGTSLKRKKIPPPLDLSSCSSGSTTAPNSNLNTAVQGRHSRHARVESAPPNVPRFPRSTFTSRPVGKPRVQYLGKVRPVQSISQHQQLQQGGYKLKTPFIPRMPLVPWQQQQQQPQYYPYPYAPATAAAVPPLLQPPIPPPIPQTYQRPYNYPVPPRSAIPLQIPYYQDYQGFTPYTTTQRKKPQHSGTAKTAVDDSEELRNKESEADQQNLNQSQRNHENEYSQLTVDDDTTFSSSSSSTDESMHGEIRIQRNVFSFEFPGSSPAIDKKMFMSICDKVWDESRELAKV